MAHLHSIFLTGDDAQAELPWALSKNIESFVHYHPGFKHTLWDDESGRDFIATHFGTDVVEAWEELVPLSYRSDLLRFCLLHELGGIYADMSVHFFAPLVETTHDESVVLFRDMFNKAPWIVTTALIHSPAGSELFANCIARIVKHVREGYYGANALCPTGPNLLGSEVAKWGQLDQLSLGEAIGIIRTNGGRSAGLNYVDATGRLIAVIPKSGSGLASLGAKKQNDYNDFYKRRKIYRRELRTPDVFTLADYLDRAMLNGEIKQDGSTLALAQGCALYGPYVPLEAGAYTARFIFEGEIPRGASIDVLSSGSRLIDAKPAKVDGQSLSLDFVLNEDLSKVEVRLILQQAQEVAFNRLELHRSDLQ